MSTVEEIEAAICALPTRERSRLVRDLAKILPELDGDAWWEAIAHDERRRPDLSKWLDEAEVAVREDPAGLPPTTDEEFERRS